MIARELKILLLEDIAEEANLIERAIRRERIPFVCHRVESRKEYSEALATFGPDVVLSDHALPEFNSIEALNLCRKHSATMPFILVTGTVSEEFAVTCLKQGADDYVLKSNLSRLPAAIVNSLNQREAEAKKKAAERELRVQNEQLLRSNDELLKINSELDNFVYSVSHNLRGPLTSILGIINVARLTEGEHSGEKFLSMIEERVGRLDETLKDILDYSRNSRSEIREEPVNLREIFFQSFERQRYLPGADTIATRFEPDGDVIISSDPYRVGLIFNNLVANSIRYADPAKEERFIKVRVGMSRDIRIELADNGQGIQPDVLPRIFEMFYRGNMNSEGAGLGLYIAKEAVLKLKGRIDVHSTEREGTTFTITLPGSTNV